MESLPNPWRPIATCEAQGPFELVDLWLTINPSPMSMGIGDAFRVIECWRENGKWFHVYKMEKAELASHYVTHWMPMPLPPNPA